MAIAKLHPCLSGWCLQTSSRGLPGHLYSGMVWLMQGTSKKLQGKRRQDLFLRTIPAAFLTHYQPIYGFMEHSLCAENKRGKTRRRSGLKTGLRKMPVPDRCKLFSITNPRYLPCPFLPWLVAWEAEPCWPNRASSPTSCILIGFSHWEAWSQWWGLERWRTFFPSLY